MPNSRTSIAGNHRRRHRRLVLLPGPTRSDRCSLATIEPSLEPDAFIRLCPDLTITAAGFGRRSLPPGKPGLLLVRLALAGGRGYARNHLVECVWPDCDPDVGRPRLRFALSALRGEYGLSDLLLASKNEVSLDWSRIDTDVERFRRAVMRANLAEDVATRGQLLAEACETVDGELAEQYGAHWLEPARRELRYARVDAFYQSAALFQNLGEFATAENLLRRAISLDPLRESVNGELMRVLAKDGRHAEAVAHFEEFRRGIQRELGLQPSDQLHVLAESILSTAAESSAARALPGGGSAHATGSSEWPRPIRRRLFGRESILREIEESLRESNVVTLVGIGGAGKTTLAVEIYRNHQASGGCFVDLSDTRSIADVFAAIRACAGIRDDGTQGFKYVLCEHLRANPGLLVLDNCEQVIEAVRELVREIGIQAPATRVLATSRRRLGVPGEVLVGVNGLAVPEDTSQMSVDDLSRLPAMSLFLHAAGAADRRFVLGPSNCADVVRLLRTIDGLPLSIELAAARIRLMSPSEILSRLRDGLDILSAPYGPSRQRRVAGIVEWTLEALSPGARRLLFRLSVFAGGWNLQVAAALMGDVAETANALDELVECSLVSRKSQHRFRMLESIRPVALRHLSTEEDEAEARDRHLRVYLGIYEPRKDEWWGKETAEWLRAVEADMPNIRQALQWAATRPDEEQLGERLAGAVWRSWTASGAVIEGGELLRGLLRGRARMPSNRASAGFLQALAALEGLIGNLDEAYALALRALSTSRTVGDALYEACSLLNLGDLAIRRRQPDGAAGLYQEALALFQRLDNPKGVCLALQGVARSHSLRQDHEVAVTYYLQALPYAKQVGDDIAISMALNNLGDSLFYLGKIEQARDHFVAATKLRPENAVTRALLMVNLGLTAIELGDFAEARKLHSEALALRRNYGEMRRVGRSETQLGIVCLAEGNLVEATRWFNDAIATLDAVGEAFEAAAPRLWLAAARLRYGDVEGTFDLVCSALRTLLDDPGPVLTAFGLDVAADLCIRIGAVREGAMLLGAGEAVRSRRNLMTPRLERELAEAAAKSARETLGEDFEALAVAGRSLAEADALGIAIRALAGCGRTRNFRWRFSEYVDRWTLAAAIEAALLS